MSVFVCITGHHIKISFGKHNKKSLTEIMQNLKNDVKALESITQRRLPGLIRVAGEDKS